MLWYCTTPGLSKLPEGAGIGGLRVVTVVLVFVVVVIVGLVGSSKTQNKNSTFSHHQWKKSISIYEFFTFNCMLDMW